MAEAKDEKVVKLVDPRGVTVTVRESKADRLKEAGYKTPAQAKAEADAKAEAEAKAKAQADASAGSGKTE